MRTAKKAFVMTAAASVLGLALSGSAMAAPITGSDAVTASVSSSTPSGNIGAATSFGLGSNLQTFSPSVLGTGSFAVIPIGTTVTLAGTTFNLGNVSTFGFTSPTVGTFTPGALSLSNQTATSLNVTITGAFAPGSLFLGDTAPNGVTETLFFTQSAAGGPISLTGTFAANVPEPLPIGMIGAGLAGIWSLRFRRKAVKKA